MLPGATSSGQADPLSATACLILQSATSQSGQTPMARKKITNPTMGRAMGGFSEDALAKEAAGKPKRRSTAAQKADWDSEVAAIAEGKDESRGGNPMIPEGITRAGEAQAAGLLNAATEKAADDGEDSDTSDEGDAEA